MSLQVWLPLNGNLHNQGLFQANINGTAFSVNSSGKIGQCIKTNSTTGIDLGFNGNQINTGSISFGGWFKFNQSEIASVVNGKTYASNATSATGNLIGNNSYGGVSLQWVSNNIYSSGNFSSISVQSCIRTSTNGHRATTAFTLPFDTWTHIFLTYNKDNNLLGLWINGELEYTNIQVPFTDARSYNLFINLSGIAGGNGPGAYIPFYCNDIRIYDHCLSIKEVEEISKGLVLHYKLDKQYTSIPSKNLFISSGFTSTDYTNMTTSNSDTSNWSKYLRWYNGSKAIHSFSDGADTIKLNNTGNLGVAFVRKATDIGLDPDSYYTLSCEAKCTKSGAQLGIGTSYYTTANAWVWRGGANKFTFAATNTWQTFTYTFKPDSNTQYICYCFTCANGVSGGTDTFSIRHCQLEKGSTAAGWVLNNADIDYKGNEIDDCSGYNNNGTLIGSLTTETSSPRYTVYTHFPATTTKIHILDFLTSGFSNSYSFAWWGKRNANNTMFWGFLDGIRLNGMFSGNLWNTGDSSSNPLYKIGTTTQVTAPSLNQWHHYVMTGDGTKCYVYLDGELWAEAKTYKTISGTSIYINGWDNTTSYSSNNMDISDFRIYATALTAEQVKELYNTSATIDKNGNIYARELVE